MGDHGFDELLGTEEWLDWRRRVRSDRPGLSSERDHIRREIEKHRARLAELDEAANRFGDEPPVGTIITFSKHFPNSIKTYSYAALRVGPERMVGAGWFLTGRDGKQPRTWEWLTDFIGDGPFRIILPHAFVAGPDGEMVAFTPRKAPSWNDIARLGRKTALKADPVLDEVRRPFSAFVDFYDAPNPAAPYRAVHSLTSPHWEVVNVVTGELKTVFPTDRDGERRARQSAHDRNRAVWENGYQGGRIEPPVGSVVRSKANPRLWAEHRDDGWMRYNGVAVQAVRLCWSSVRHQLDVMEPGRGRQTNG